MVDILLLRTGGLPSQLILWETIDLQKMSTLPFTRLRGTHIRQKRNTLLDLETVATS